MALLYRLKHLKLNHIKRCYYFHISIPHKTANHCYNHHNYYTNYPIHQSVYRPPEHTFINGVRFFAAPVQVKKKEEVKTPSGHRLNDQITAEFIRLVTEDGHSVVPRHEALRRALSLKLDLVEVDRQSKPPVCKIMDYNRERYKQHLRVKERTKAKSDVTIKKGDCKEVRFSAKTELKDLKMKADTAKRLMERGYRVKCMAMGTEEQDLGGLLSQLSAMLEDVSIVESGPRVEKKQAYFIVRHVKFGPPKKGGKKASKAEGSTSSEMHSATSSESLVDFGEAFSEESGVDDDVVDEPLGGHKETSWSVSNANYDFDKMFDLHHDDKKISSPANKQMKFDFEAPSASTRNASRFSPSAPKIMDPNVRPPPQEPENRYARNAAKNSSASALRNPMRFPNNGSQPQSRSTVPPTGGPRQAGSEGSAFRRFQHPQSQTPQAPGKMPYQSRQHERHSNFPGSNNSKQ